MRRTTNLTLVFGVALAVIACGGTTPATNAPRGTGAAVPPGGGTATGTECAAFPTFSLANPNPSFPADEALLAKFPATIAGAPATDVSAVPFGAFMCLAGQAAYNQAVAGMPAGSNWASVGWGSATYTIGGEEITLTAFHTPGQTAQTMVDSLLRLAAAQGQQLEGTMSQGTVGGKNAIIVTQPDGNKNYGYAAGDTLFFIEEDVSEEQAATVLAALP